MTYDILVYRHQADLDAGQGARIIEGLTEYEAFYIAKDWLERFPIVAVEAADRSDLQVYRRDDKVH